MSNSIEKLPALGMTSSLIANAVSRGRTYLNTETDQLIKTSEKYFSSTVLIDPLAVAIDLVQGQESKIFSHGIDISHLTVLLVLGTKGVEKPIRALVHALSNHGCQSVDPVERFAGTKASKLITTIQRHDAGIGSTSYIAFSTSSAYATISRIVEDGSFPLIVKPIYGKHGIGIIKLHNEREAREVIDNHFAAFPDEPLLMQNFNVYIQEFRCLVIHGKCIGSVEKHKKADSIIANASASVGFTAVHNKELENFTLSNVSEQGLIGVDVGITRDGKYQVIEANRAPEWATFQQAVGFNVAEVIIKEVYGKARENIAD